MLGGNRLDLVIPANQSKQALELVSPIATGDVQFDHQKNLISIPVSDQTKALIAVATTLAEAGIQPEDLALRRPTLDEVFLHLTAN
jgi:ABC-2 type transport system ATP-binding protein